MSLHIAAPQASLSILSAVNKVTPAAPLLDRYRNELAASLLGIKTSQVSSEGLKALYKLNALAPELTESDVVFLPQARAVNLMKVCQKWIGGSEEEAGDDEGDDDDEEAGEEVESEMTAVFANVVTILQSVPGSHWSFMFDVVENNLEVSKGHCILARQIADSTFFRMLPRRTLRACWCAQEHSGC